MSFVAAETLWQSFSISDIDRAMGIEIQYLITKAPTVWTQIISANRLLA